MFREIPTTISAIVLVGLGASLASAADQPAAGFETIAKPYLKQYCIDCHGPAKQKGELRLDGIGEPAKDLPSAQGWNDILGRVTLGEMPPKKHPAQPTADETRRVVAWIRDGLRQAESMALSRGGRVVMRRLNRAEYENTIRDLLGVDLRVGDELPPDPKAVGFDNIGAALTMSPLHIEKYLRLAEEAIALAIDARPKRPDTELWRFEMRQIPPNPSDPRRQPQNSTQILHLRGGDLAEPLTRRHPQWDDTAGQTKGKKECAFFAGGEMQGEWYVAQNIERKGEGGSMSSHLQNFIVRDGGEYRIRARVRCDFDPLSWAHEMPRFQIKPAPTGNRLYLDGTFRESGRIEVFEGRFRAASGERLNLRYGFPDHRTPWKYNGEVRMPRVLVDWIEIEGPCFDFVGWPSPTQRALLGDWTDTAQAPSADQVHDIFLRFLTRAFRRPPTVAEIARRERVVAGGIKAGLSPVEAISLGFISAMTSAPFAYLVEPRQGDAKRALDDHELATRLSYFLWGTMPDQHLRGLAGSGKLRDPTVLAAEARRMLADPRARFLSERFAAQWLDLAKFSSVSPDGAIYPEWSEALRADLRAEAIAFFAEILHSGRPLTTFLASDFAMLNERLAAHYRIPGVTGSHLRPVALRPEWHRGGLIGLGSIQCLTSNGTRTSPVIRGVYLLDRILDDPPPPPPANAGEIDNKVPGEDKATVRERLAIHRQVESCAACHAKIDPLGFALENYNAIGRWQVRESSGDPNKPVKIGGAIDASGAMPDGRSFRTLADFQAILRADEERFAHGLAKRLLIFALGRVVDFGDRALLARLAAQFKSTGTVSDLIAAIVASDQFRTE